MIDLTTLTPQCRRVLAALRAEASRGIDRTQFLAPVVYDGGKPIVNMPGRIQDLEAAGCVIGTPSRRHGNCTVYVLHSEPSARVVVKPAHQVLDDDGFSRVTYCMGCFGALRHEEKACVGFSTQSYAMSPINDPGYGCRRKEVRRVAA